MSSLSSNMIFSLPKNPQTGTNSLYHTELSWITLHFVVVWPTIPKTTHILVLGTRLAHCTVVAWLNRV